MIERRGSGLEIASEGLAIDLYPRPSAAGVISIQVVGLPAATGFDRAVALTYEIPCEFAPDEITVTDTRLDCFAPIANTTMRSFRQGFQVDLPFGMAQSLRDALPRIQDLSRESYQLLTLIATPKFCAGVEQPNAGHVLPHLSRVVYAALASVLLDKRDYEAALEEALQELHGDEAGRLRDALLSAEARELVERARGEQCAAQWQVQS